MPVHASPLSIAPPLPVEYPPYFARYIAALPAEDILSLLRHQARDTAALLSGLDDRQALYRYAPGKWSIKELVGHLIDSERVFAYRAVAFARGERQPLPGFDEDAWVAMAGFDRRPLRGLLDELLQVRAATVAFVESLDESALDRRGTANHRLTSVRAVPFILAGHQSHHVRTLRERYLKGT